MNTKTCKSCGQINLAEANSCSNCRMNLEQMQIKTTVKSNKTYWIIGGIATVIFIGGFFIVAIAAGLYFYNRPTTTFDKPSETNVNKQEITEKKDEPVEKIVFLNEIIDNKHAVLGNFKLQKATKISDREKMVFRESKDEAFALYSTDQKKYPLQILFSIAKFATTDDARTDAAAIRQKLVNEKKAKILRETKLSDGVILSYKQNNVIGILDCKNRTCLQISGIDGPRVSDFYKLATANLF